jgi:dolichyl-phosphate-mannose-protein mannosyltransferase
MGRQRFLHHYLPSHLASTLVTGALVEFIFNFEPIQPAYNSSSSSAGTLTDDDHSTSSRSKDDDDKTKTKTTSVVAITHAANEQHHHFVTAKERMGPGSLMATWAATMVILAVTIYGFIFFAPLTYGTPGLDVDQVNARKWLSYDLHFAK